MKIMFYMSIEKSVKVELLPSFQDKLKKIKRQNSIRNNPQINKKS
jgi:hypothetical protein